MSQMYALLQAVTAIAEIHVQTKPARPQKRSGGLGCHSNAALPLAATSRPWRYSFLLAIHERSSLRNRASLPLLWGNTPESTAADVLARESAFSATRARHCVHEGAACLY